MMIRKRTTIIITVAVLLTIVLAVASFAVASKRVDLVKAGRAAYDPNIPDLPQHGSIILPAYGKGYDPNSLSKPPQDPNTPEMSQCNAAIVIPCKCYYDPNIPDY